MREVCSVSHDLHKYTTGVCQLVFICLKQAKLLAVQIGLMAPVSKFAWSLWPFLCLSINFELGACVSECKRNLKGLQSHRMWDFTVFGARSYPSFYRTVKWNSVGDHAKCQEERASHLQQQQQKIQVYKIKIWQVEIIFSLNLLSSSFR